MRILFAAAAITIAALTLPVQAEDEGRSLAQIAAALQMTEMELLTAGATGALAAPLQKEVDQALRARLSGGGSVIAQPVVAQEG